MEVLLDIPDATLGPARRRPQFWLIFVEVLIAGSAALSWSLKSRTAAVSGTIAAVLLLWPLFSEFRGRRRRQGDFEMTAEGVTQGGALLVPAAHLAVTVPVNDGVLFCPPDGPYLHLETDAVRAEAISRNLPPSTEHGLRVENPLVATVAGVFQLPPILVHAELQVVGLAILACAFFLPPRLVDTGLAAWALVAIASVVAVTPGRLLFRPAGLRLAWGPWSRGLDYREIASAEVRGPTLSIRARDGRALRVAFRAAEIGGRRDRLRSFQASLARLVEERRT